MRDSMNESWKRPDVGNGAENDDELSRLLAAYRDACPAPEAKADFMPRLWERIDGSQNWTRQLWKWANGMMAAAAAASLFFVMLQLLPKHSLEFYGATYLETLANQHDDDEALESVAVLNLKAPQELPAK